MEPNRESALTGAAYLAAQAGRREDAIAYWQRAIAISPWRSDYRAELASLYFQSRDWRAAAEACRETLRLNPANLEVRKLLVRCYLRLGDPGPPGRIPDPPGIRSPRPRRADPLVHSVVKNPIAPRCGHQRAGVTLLWVHSPEKTRTRLGPGSASVVDRDSEHCRQPTAESQENRPGADCQHPETTRLGDRLGDEVLVESGVDSDLAAGDELTGQVRKTGRS